MTEETKKQIREQYNILADKQAEAVITGYETLEKNMPKDMTDQQKEALFKDALETTYKLSLQSTEQFGNELKQQISNIKL